MKGQIFQGIVRCFHHTPENHSLCRSRGRETAKSIGQCSVALLIVHAFDGHANGIGRPDQDRQLFGPCEASIYEIATEQQVMLQEQGQNHGLILAALALVNGHCPGQWRFQLGGRQVGQPHVRELHHHHLLLQVDRADGANIAIEDLPAGNR